MNRKNFGHAGHLIVAAQCRFHLHTHVGKWCISTVGDYHLASDPEGEAVTVGSGRLYETMVFNLRSRGANRWGEVDFAGYNDFKSADAGHEAMVKKYEAK